MKSTYQRSPEAVMFSAAGQVVGAQNPLFGFW